MACNGVLVVSRPNSQCTLCLRTTAIGLVLSHPSVQVAIPIAHLLTICGKIVDSISQPKVRVEDRNSEPTKRAIVLNCYMLRVLHPNARRFICNALDIQAPNTSVNSRSFRTTPTSPLKVLGSTALRTHYRHAWPGHCTGLDFSLRYK